MIARVDETHDAGLKSWVPSANRAGNDFPIQNLPFGIFKRQNVKESPRAGVAIGDRILDMAACDKAGLFTGEAGRAAGVCADVSLNRFAALDRGTRLALRRRLSELLREGATHIQDFVEWETLLLPKMEACAMSLPMEIGDYTDFYSSIHHASTVGSLFRPDQPLLPNYKYVPIGYHGRASSIVVSGTPIRRPRGQTLAEGAPHPEFGPSKLLDYEVETGFLIGAGNTLGEPIGIRDAEDHLFGICLLNDWSARDIQKWEYQPLGPFLAKSFATTLSPWVVTLEALGPYRVPAFRRPQGDPAPLAYLDQGEHASLAGFDVHIEAYLSTARMRERGNPPVRLSQADVRDLYWTPGQLLAHHASNGCNLRSGDLLGSGTVSGPAKENEGCLLELTRGGKEPVILPDGETRRFLVDGDEITLKGHCEAAGFARIGLGECRGAILPTAG